MKYKQPEISEKKAILPIHLQGCHYFGLNFWYIYVKITIVVLFYWGAAYFKITFTHTGF